MKRISKKVAFAVLTLFLLTTIAGATIVNYKQDKDIDRTKIPQKLELSKPFQKWITNLKNKGLIIEADEFRLKEENEIYNTSWMTVYNIDDVATKAQYDANIIKYLDIKKVVYSPSDRQFIDYRNEPRDGYDANQIHYYGLRDDKLLDARLLDCATNLNCYFDRAYFLDNDVFAVSEISRNFDKRANNIPPCGVGEVCAYTVKIHLVDLNKNSRLVYESKPFETNLALLMEEL
ncbi:MAG: hypothetical protein WC988_01530 [Patescibacteria group bacterium]